MAATTSNPILSHHAVTAGGASPHAWLFVLHGIFGAGRNWASIARRLVGRRSDWGAVLVDLRLHADSQRFAPPHTLAACARDLHELAKDLGTDPKAVMGHSFGGKVALLYARHAYAGLSQVWLMDSTPARHPPTGAAVEMMDFVRRFDRFVDRDAAVTALLEAGFAPSVARWMVTNLVRRGEAYRWRFDVNGVEMLLRDFSRVDAWDVVERPPGDVDLHFVKATGSDLLTETECRRIEESPASGVHLHRLEGGHWLNADNPEEVLRLLGSRLPHAHDPS